MIFLFKMRYAFAQLPGGVSSNLKLWLRADAGVFFNAGVTAANNNSTIQQWNDYSNLGNHASQPTVAYRPTFKNNATDNINFNPIIRFSFSNSEWFSYPIGTAPTGSNPFEVFIVSRVGTLTGYRAMYGAGTTGTNNGVGCYFDNGLLRFHFTGNTFMVNASPVTTGAILQTTWGYSTANGRQMDLNGTQLGTETTKIANITSAAGKVGLDWSSSNYFDGDIAEIVLFAADNSLADKNKIETYLFLKYGITGTHDYISSNGTTIWDVGGSGGFDHDIAGLGRDAALHQKQSTSMNSDDIITMANGSVATDNNMNINALTNGSYLIWGNNDGSKLFTSRMSGTSLDRMERAWRVQETGTIGNVLVRIPASVISGTTPKIVQSSDAVFTGTDGSISMSLNGAYYEAMVDFTDGQYFTIAQTPVPAPGGVSQYLKFWVKADTGLYSDAGVTPATLSSAIQQWNDQSGYNQHAVQATVAQRPTYLNRHLNFNPTVYFDQTTDQHLTFPASAATTGSESFEVFAVTRPMNLATLRPFFGFGTGSTNDGAGLSMKTGKLRFNFSGNPFTVSNAFVTPNYVYETGMAYNTPNGRQIYFNGVLQGSDNSIVPTIQSTVGKIGLDYSISGTWEGDIAELIFLRN